MARIDSTLHRHCTLFVQDTGGPIALEALGLVVRTFTVPLEVQTRRGLLLNEGYNEDCVPFTCKALKKGYNIHYVPPTEEKRETVKRIAGINKGLSQQCRSYLGIPRDRLPHFILGQYLDYVTRKATLLLTNGTDEGTFQLFCQPESPDADLFFVTKVSLKAGILKRKKRSHRIELWCYSHEWFALAELFDPKDPTNLWREPAVWEPRLLQPSALRAFFEGCYADQPLCDLKMQQRPFFPQPYLELRLAAFCMITHARLGSGSVWGGLPVHLVEEITHYML